MVNFKLNFGEIRIFLKFWKDTRLTLKNTYANMQKACFSQFFMKIRISRKILRNLNFLAEFTKTAALHGNLRILLFTKFLIFTGKFESPYMQTCLLSF
jgi:hypothetical protein